MMDGMIVSCAKPWTRPSSKTSSYCPTRPNTRRPSTDPSARRLLRRRRSGDRRGYQMDVANIREAIREVALDVERVRTFVMVKPALPCLDVISEVRREFDVPVAAYNVSGEYAMLKLAGQKGLLDYDRSMMETLISIRRAGADLVVTYHAKEAAHLLTGKR